MTEARFINGPMDGQRMIVDVAADGRILIPEWTADAPGFTPPAGVRRVHVYVVEQEAGELVARYAGWEREQ
jgi:hypothetical protein